MVLFANFLCRALIAIQAAVPRHEMGVATAVRNFVRIFGSAMVVPIASAIVSNRLREAMNKFGLAQDTITTVLDDPTVIRSSSFLNQHGRGVTDAIMESYHQGFKGVFYMTAACMAIAACSAMFLIEEHNLSNETVVDSVQTPNSESADTKVDTSIV